jgi:hypothetical protein
MSDATVETHTPVCKQLLAGLLDRATASVALNSYATTVATTVQL